MSWEMVKLEEVGEIISGSTPKTNNASYWGGSINWITPAEIIKGYNGYITKTERTLTEEGFKSSNLTLLPKGAVLLTSRAPIGKVALVGSPICTNQGFKSIICNNKLIYNEYLYHYLVTQYEQLNYLGRGATFKEISKKIIQNIKIPLPPLEIQEKIVSALDKAQELITLRKEQIKLLDDLIQSIFYDMFGDPVTNPMGWDLHEFSYGTKNIKYGISTPPQFCNNGIPFIRATNIKYGRITINSMKYISKEESQKIEKCKLDYGDIIIVRSGVNTGDTTYITKDYAGAYGGYDLIVKLNDLLNPVYINSLFASVYRERVITQLTRRAAQQHLNSKQVSGLNICFPPIKLQNQFAERVEKIESQKALMEQSLKEMENNFNSTMQRAFKGELF